MGSKHYGTRCKILDEKDNDFVMICLEKKEDFREEVKEKFNIKNIYIPNIKLKHDSPLIGERSTLFGLHKIIFFLFLEYNDYSIFTRILLDKYELKYLTTDNDYRANYLELNGYEEPPNPKDFKYKSDYEEELYNHNLIYPDVSLIGNIYLWEKEIKIMYTEAYRSTEDIL